MIIITCHKRFIVFHNLWFTAQTQEWRVKNLADLLESLVGALFLDKGIKYVEGFMQVLFFPRLKVSWSLVVLRDRDQI